MFESLVFYISLIIVITVFSVAVESVDTRNMIRNKIWKNDVALSLKYIVCMGVIILVPTLVAALRDNVGRDFASYEYLFGMYVNSATFNNIRFGGYNIEILIYYLCKVGYFLFHDFHGFLFIVAFLSYGIALKSFKRHYSDAFFPIMVYAYFMCLLGPSYNIIKQILAVSVVTFGFKYIEERKPINYLLIITIAALCHTSAIFCVVFYFFCSSKQSDNKIRQILIVGIAMAAPFMFSTAFQLMGNFSIFAKYSSLYATDFEANVNVNRLLPHLPIAAVIGYNCKKLLDCNYKNSMYLCIYLFKFVALALSFYTDYSFRLMYYCIPAEIILVGKLIKASQGYPRLFYTIFSSFYYLVYFIFSFFVLGLDGIFPYCTIWG